MKASWIQDLMKHVRCEHADAKRGLAMPEKNSYCSFCGNRLPDQGLWPRRCSACGNTTYLNPVPVVVVLVPVDEGVVVIRRNTEPQKGMLALPGGYIDYGETWQEGASRELLEETGIEVPCDEISLYDVQNGLDNTLVVFGLAAKQPSRALEPFSSEETTEVILIDRPIELAFTMHTDVVRRYLERKKRTDGGG
jgi:ADP-ribose pyrophosphatase YjhB (NUDIX family)